MLAAVTVHGAGVPHVTVLTSTGAYIRCLRASVVFPDKGSIP